FHQNRFVIIGAGAIVLALLIFLATSMPSKRPAPKSNGAAAARQGVPSEGSAMPGDKSLFPIIDSGRPAAKETHDGFYNGRDLDRTATARPPIGTPPSREGNTGGTLASIPPFGEQQVWQAPPYQSAPRANDAAESSEP